MHRTRSTSRYFNVRLAAMSRCLYKVRCTVGNLQLNLRALPQSNMEIAVNSDADFPGSWIKKQE
jgi:hypothetical protein